ncbi:MAG: hypothetical protein WC369_08465 [Dehalococcoidales bacterium]|jgi:hypothetical protein|nr:hypothetical protein [Dehalococcoidales bacterium]
MKITVEVGTVEQKNIIEKELKLIQTLIGAFTPPLNICQVIVPFNFDQKVNEIQNTDYYKSVRGVVALAKIIEIDDSIAVIISPRIYTEEWDIQTRVFIYLHEILHVANKKQLRKPEIESASLSLYFENIYRLFDEYMADRQALELIDKVFPEKSDRMRRSVVSNVDGFIGIINNQRYHEQISKEIASFRIYGKDVTKFLENTHDSFSEVAMSIVHLFSYIDNYPDYQNRVSDLRDSRFMNYKTQKLIDFFRQKYKEKSPELAEGLNLVKEFMLNFGMRFEDTPQGMYCHVIDI